jgi:predicted membrane protein
MDTQTPNTDFNRPRRDGRILAGLFLLFVGAIFFLRELSFPFFPNWLFTWPMILITIGIYTGFKHQFRNISWLVLILIGSFFLIDQMDLGFNLHRFMIPAGIIAVGLFMILRPRRWVHEDWGNWENRYQDKYAKSSQASAYSGYSNNSSSEDFFDSTSVFGGAKKVILSKDFKGGDITCIFGGCEIDLSQADMQQPAVIDFNLVFGGGKIIIPSNWQLRLDITPVFGGIEDKRRQPLSNNPDKILVLKGTCFFGGLEIKNF